MNCDFSEYDCLDFKCCRFPSGCLEITIDMIDVFGLLSREFGGSVADPDGSAAKIWP